MNSIQSAPFPSQSMLDDFSATAFATSSKRNFEDGVILSTSLNPLEQLTSIAEQQQQHAWAILNDQSPAKKQRRASFGSSRRSSLDDHALMLQRPSSPLEALVMALENSSPEGDASEQSMQVCDGMAKVDPTDANMMNASHSASHSTGRRRSLASGERKIYACEFEGCNKHFMQLAHLRIHERCHTGLRPYVSLLHLARINDVLTQHLVATAS
ncbi:hypothetical protein BC937DRAFT_95385 [Endogone sp. FLAS-F59071]|nr:hypothetical protein BC937DRAFT_95385 [Endogone sp. FLAS-F59071]|eukprot:RUS13398.1 hypothetical protein BC937DRAFT_95385 [Endogone sp. FLAS-F59071]